MFELSSHPTAFPWPSGEDVIFERVRAAFRDWENILSTVSGDLPARVTLFEKITSGTPNIRLFRRDISPSPGDALFSAVPPLLANGFVSQVTIDFDDVIIDPTYWKKVTLHELGHALGLDDFAANYSERHSVMRGHDGFNDIGGGMPEVVTVCDMEMARKAVEGSVWPRPPQ